MKQQIVFFVGPDQCGKTHIAQEVSKRLQVPYFKASSEHATYLSGPGRFVNQLRYADTRVVDLLKQTGQSIVFDRGYPCEKAYSQVFFRVTDDDVLKHVDEAYAALGAKIVCCYRFSYRGIVDDIDPNIKGDTLYRLEKAYREFLSSSSGCEHMMLCVDDENLDREVDDVLRFLKGAS